MNAARTITYKGYVYAQPSSDWEKGNTTLTHGRSLSCIPTHVKPTKVVV